MYYICVFLKETFLQNFPEFLFIDLKKIEKKLPIFLFTIIVEELWFSMFDHQNIYLWLKVGAQISYRKESEYDKN